MKIYDYTNNEEVDISCPSIFLAGPTPRDYNTMLTHEWRTPALEILRKLECNCNVYIPGFIDKYDHVKGDSDSFDISYNGVIDWELAHLNEVNCIAFWIPRQVNQGMPGFTTNVEFGMFVRSGKCVLGYPEFAEHIDYIHRLARLNDVPISNTLLGTMSKAIVLATTRWERGF